ncbi:MAG: hypothetical protein NC485_10770 [Ruminococcus flavefaciens]|nr:hypothetical protein [Ruminococcus flavefaciens]MCM1060908.1 hypothetical protein [Eubacterium sp.]
MISFTILEELSKACGELAFCIDGIDHSMLESTEIISKLTESRRKIEIAAILYGKQTICIAGLQGEGKTTLIKNFYNISDEFFNVTEGRGERIPIIITEKDIQNPEMYICKTCKANKYAIEEEKITDPAKFREISSKRNDDNTNDVLYMELRVPKQHLFNDESCFLLLPGFEEDETDWQDVVEFSLHCSDAAIMVSSHTGLASLQNFKMMKEQSDLFKGHIIYAVTRCDEKGEDKNAIADIKRTCIHDLNIPEQNEDRVVCTGVYTDKEKNKQWIDALESAIENYCSQEPAEQKCAQFVIEEANKIYSQCRDIYREIDNKIKITDILQDAEIQSWINVFDREFKKSKKTFEKNLNKSIGMQSLSANAVICREYQQKFNVSKMHRAEKVIGIVKDVGRAIGLNQYNDLSTCRNIVDKAVRDNNYGQEYWSSCAVKALSESIPNDYMVENGLNNNIRQITVKNEGTIMLPIEIMMKNALTLLSNKKDTYLIECNEEGYDVKNIIKFIVNYATSVFMLNEINIGIETDQSLRENLDNAVLQNSFYTLDSKPDNIKNDLSKKIGLGALLTMGVDGIDGQLDIIVGLASTFGISSKNAGMGILVLGAGGFTRNAMREIDCLKIKLEQSCLDAKNRYYETLVKDSIKKYTEYMDNIKDKLSDHLCGRNSNRDLTYAYIAKNSLSRIQKSIDEIRWNLKETAYAGNGLNLR